MEKIISFNEAIDIAGAKKHLLLGNGFSIALKPDIFSYASLFEECRNRKCISAEATKIFDCFHTRDFEVVIRALNDTAKVMKGYTKSAKIIDKLYKDANSIKKALVDLLSAKHPSNPNEITESQYGACIQFLSNFEKIYTLNYDLLLYWAVMKAIKTNKTKYDDGFRHVDEEECVVWHPEEAKNQNIYYLHGALHLFDTGAEVKKFTWVNTGIRLIEQIQRELEQDNFPLFVAEGNSHEKMTKINHSQYLGKGLRSLVEIQGSLFIYGHSLAENDSHYLNLIAKGKIRNLFVGIYDNGTPGQSAINMLIMRRAECIASARLQEKSKYPIKVMFYDAQSANVWGHL